MPDQSAEVNRRSEASAGEAERRLEQTCLNGLPDHIRFLVNGRDICPCSVLMVYRHKGERATLRYLIEVLT